MLQLFLPRYESFKHLQSKNQVVILGISIFEKRNRPLSRCLPTFMLPPGLRTFLQCSGRVQSKNKVDLVDINIFYKLKKTSGQTRSRLKKKSSALYLIMAA